MKFAAKLLKFSSICAILRQKVIKYGENNTSDNLFVFWKFLLLRLWQVFSQNASNTDFP